MPTWLRDPLARAVLVGVIAATLFLALSAATGDVDGTEWASAVGVAIGAAIGGEIGRRRAERRAGGSKRRY